VYASFLRLSVINILSNLMVPLAGIIDVAFLGHLADIRHLAGVSLATIIFNYIYWSFGFLRMGTTGMSAQAVGRNDTAGLWAIGIRNSIIAVCLGMTVLVLQYPLGELGFFLLSADANVEEAGRAFFNARIWGAPATLVNFVLLGWFLGRSHGGKVLVLSIVGNGANVVLDYWMIVQLGWESAGAGLATALSQYTMLMVGIGLILWERPKQVLASLQWSTDIFGWKQFRHVFALNRDILIRTLALVTAFSLFTNFSAAIGTTLLAVNTLMLQVVTLAAYFIDGLAFATESFVGMVYGKGLGASGAINALEYRTLRLQLIQLLKVGGSLSILTGLMFAIAFALLPNQLFGLLTIHTEVIAAAEEVVVWLIPVLGFGAIAFILDGYFIGLTQGRVLRNASLIAALVGFLPVALVAWQRQDPHLLWLSLTLFMVARGITLGIKVPETMRSPIP
jgi:MATE family multidrug resistance protein